MTGGRLKGLVVQSCRYLRATSLIQIVLVIASLLLRFLAACLIFLLLMWTCGCDLFGYHYIDRFPIKTAVRQKEVEHLLSRYYFIPILSRDEYKIRYEYKEKGKLIPEGLGYVKKEDQVGLDDNLYSGTSKRLSATGRSELKKLEAFSGQGISAESTLRGPTN